jgi:hypothetical protein
MSDVPVQPKVATLTYTKVGAPPSTFGVMPYLQTPTSWATTYPTMGDAAKAANSRAWAWDGEVTFGVVQAKDGAFLIRPMETENGNSFLIDRDLLGLVGATKVTATATAPELLALVGARDWLDLTSARTDVEPVAYKR